MLSHRQGPGHGQAMTVVAVIAGYPRRPISHRLPAMNKTIKSRGIFLRHAAKGAAMRMISGSRTMPDRPLCPFLNRGRC